jgi:RHS repeat-associated protein
MLAITDFGYTGQRALDEDMGGMMDYKARFYSSSLGRFTQPDTYIPNITQGLNRYSYVYNNPINYVDVSGHDPWWCGGNDACMFDWFTTNTSSNGDAFIEKYNVTLDGQNWTEEHKRAVIGAVSDVGSKFASEREQGETASEAFKAIFGSMTFTWDDNCYDCRSSDQIANCGNFFGEGCKAGGAITRGSHNIVFASMAGDNATSNAMFRSIRNVVHELGHAYDNLLGFGPRNDMEANHSWMINDRASILSPNVDYATVERCDDCFGWQQNRTKSNVETFGDMFVAWTYGTWNTDPVNQLMVSDAQNWMNGWMP